MMTITVPLEKWASYGEILRSEDPEKGWDILAVLEEDVPYSGTMAIPVVHPSSGSCSGYVSMENASLNGVRKSHVFLLGKSRDQCLAERDAKIEELKAALVLSEKNYKTVCEHKRNAIEETENLKTRFANREKAWADTIRDRDVFKEHCLSAQKHLGEKVWLEAIGKRLYPGEQEAKP